MHCNIDRNHTIFHRHVDHKWCCETQKNIKYVRYQGIQQNVHGKTFIIGPMSLKHESLSTQNLFHTQCVANYRIAANYSRSHINAGSRLVAWVQCAVT